MSDALHVPASATTNDAQAEWISDGLEMVVDVLGILGQAHPKHEGLELRESPVEIDPVPIRHP